MKSFLKELFYGVSIVVLLYVIGLLFGETIWQIVVNTPQLNSVYLVIMDELESRSVFGLSAMTFIGGLFFVAYPAELLFFIYAQVGYNMLYVALIMVIYTMAAQVINYATGYYIEKRILAKVVKSRRKLYLEHLKKYDFYFITILNILPLPADILSVLLGMMKYDFKKAMLYTLLGKIIKFVFLILLVMIIWFKFF